ncbi:PaaI family thioesterase [Pseudalkalibacillus caeni]|uniref:Hotdog fold thioesterase n=1 Tax=Exobacillus caeni TaxID=2574798 RepID=A0A5R9F7J6_9BACL|nr:hotdog fold thioesterase [Pseudalkalibacillus caeni]TLS39001.1 hotdog fold thioesterase [Pseudalkalibacillus caeni]
MDLSNTIMEALDIKALKLEPEEVIFEMPVGPKTKQPMGYLHGGASVVLAETAASIGAFLNVKDENKMPLGLEINANHLKSVREGKVTATATPIHIGRKTMVWEVKITGEEQQLICISRCTIAVVDKPSKQSEA